MNTAFWVPATQGLRYTLGEKSLFTKEFPSLRLDRHFTELIAEQGAAEPPAKRFSPEVEVIAIHSLPVDQDLPRFTRLAHSYRYVPEHFRHYYIEANGAFEDYLKGLDPKSRHEMARKVRRFASLSENKLCCREFRRPEEIEEYHALALAVSRKTYQTQLLDAGMPEGEEFRRELLDWAAAGLVRGYILFHNSEPIAYGFCRGLRETLLYVHTGYDPGFSSLSPGIVLLNCILERFFAEHRFRRLDFGGGNAQWKRSYATASARCAVVFYFRPTLRNLGLIGLHRAMAAFSGAAAALLARFRLKNRVKGWFRSRGMSYANAK